jgi:phosphoadenosine phosphosulfate reductase
MNTKGQLYPMSIDIDALNLRFADAHPQDILEWAVATFPHQLAVVTSFQKTGVMALHMLQQLAPTLPVLTVDTGQLFPETYNLIDTLKKQLALNLHTVRATDIDLPDQLWNTDPDHCCQVRKVTPLRTALAPFEAWITGVRQDQSPSRGNISTFSLDREEKLKIAPFARWTEEMVDLYTQAHQLPYNTLYDVGYTSIGCLHCTLPTGPGGPSRSGRWHGFSKTECGIHT